MIDYKVFAAQTKEVAQGVYDSLIAREKLIKK